MKAAGIIFLIFAGLNFIAFIAATVSGVGSDIVTRELSAVFMLGALGGFLLYRAKQKEQEKDNKDKWDKGEK